MTNRKAQIEDLLEDFHSMRRCMTMRIERPSKGPRITPAQWSVLMQIVHRGESTVKEVADALGISSSAATQLVDGLVKGGYVDRVQSTADRRAVTLTLSKKTKNRVGKMKEHAVDKFLSAFTVLNDKEFSQYCALSKKLVHGFLPLKVK
jgi:DNA-binding MarR family transcriptional regulator